MFCEKCGTKNEDEARFCESCGNPLVTLTTSQTEQVTVDNAAVQSPETPVTEASTPAMSVAEAPTPETPVAEALTPEATAQNTPVQAAPVVTKVKKQLTKKQKLIMIIVGALLVVCVAFYLIGSNLSNPKKMVKAYFDCEADGSWDKAYDYLDITSGEFTTKSMYSKMMENSDDAKKEVMNYSVKEIDSKYISDSSDSLYNILGGSYSSKNDDSDDSDSNLFKYYKVEYTEKGSSTKKTEYITLIKQKSKSFFFFDNYKVAVDDLVADEFEVGIPSGATLFLDDVEIKTSNIVKGNTTDYAYKSKLDNYKFTEVFSGQHELKVTAPYMEDYSEQITIYDGGSHDVTDIKVSESVASDLNKKSEELINLVYSSAMAGKSFDEIKSNFTSDEDQLEDIESTYTSICSRVKKADGSGLKAIKFSEFEPNSKNTKLSYNLTFEVSQDFNYTYTSLSHSYFSDTITEYTPTSPSTGTLDIDYVYEDGNWVVYSMYAYIYWY